MIYNYDQAKVFTGAEGIEFLTLIELTDNKVIAAKVSDIGGGADIIPTYLVEKPV